VLKRGRGQGHTTLAVGGTADCDIANEKFGEAGLACVQLDLLANHVLGEHAKGLALGHLKRRFEKAAEWVNKRWLEKSPENEPLSEEHIRKWILAGTPEEIEAELNLPVDDRKRFIKKESVVLNKAQKLIDAPTDRYASIDALSALQGKTRGEQLKTVFGTLNPKDLPLDLFYISSVPGEPGLGFVAKLRGLTFIPFERCFTSMDAAKGADNSFVRVGRLEPTFRHALAQQFGMLFARIGMPKQYEVDRDAAFGMIADQIKAEMGELQ
jgi:hypothetical protein